MKKTLLAVAMLVASTGAFAQVKSITDNATKAQKAFNPNPVLTTDGLNKAKHAATKGTLDDATIICSFEEGTYEFGKTQRSTAQGKNSGFQYKADTSNFDNDFSFRGWFNNGYMFRLQNEDWGNMSADNGFAFIDFIALSDEQQTNTVFDAWVKCTTPILTAGMNGVDIYISQFVYRFNADRYYVEWSHDEDFAVKDSIEFNIRNLDLDVNTYKFGTVRVNIPSGTSNCEIISTDPAEKTWIRIRVTSPSGQQVHGYTYIIDDIAYAEAPESRLELISANWYNGYSQIPEIITHPDELIMQVALANTGTKDVKNASLVNKMLKGSADEEGNESYTQIDANNSGVLSVISSEAYEDTVTDNQGTITEINLRRQLYITAQEKGQANDGITFYDLESVLAYEDGNGEAMETKVASANTHYNVVDTLLNIPNGYRWARDCGAARYYDAAQTGLTSAGYITDNAATGNKDYKRCVGFSALDYDQPVYAYGVELTPAIDSASYSVATNRRTAAGARIKGSLMFYDTNATSNETVITKVLWKDDEEAVESSVYVLQETDRNVLGQIEMLKDDNGNNTAISRSLNRVYLPFTYQGTVLQPNVIYYACYEMVTNGTFAVAQDVPYSNIFGPGMAIYNIIYTPGADSYQFPWGTTFNPAFLDWVAPHIRLIVSNIKGGVEEVAENSAAINMYPNPVATNATVAYTLKNSGNVVITVTDIMGRTVLTMDEGKQAAGISYRANIPVYNMANGTYFCTVNVDGAKTTTKFVVNK